MEVEAVISKLCPTSAPLICWLLVDGIAFCTPPQIFHTSARYSETYIIFNT